MDPCINDHLQVLIIDNESLYCVQRYVELLLIYSIAFSNLAKTVNHRVNIFEDEETGLTLMSCHHIVFADRLVIYIHLPETIHKCCLFFPGYELSVSHNPLHSLHLLLQVPITCL